jgi:hypothetical protein
MCAEAARRFLLRSVDDRLSAGQLLEKLIISLPALMVRPVSS